jgi:pimeloyl-ACP methyl ester carboxylesterase
MPPLLCLVLVSLLAAPRIEGPWQGSLKTPMGAIRVVFHVSGSPDGKLTAKMDSPDQGAFGFPVDEVALEGRTVRIAIARIGFTYSGTLNDDGSEISGTLRQNGVELPLVLSKLQKTPEQPKRPQEPVPPLPYREEEVTFRNTKAGIELAGTLTVPRTAGPHPAAILISGSGPQDRNEAIAGHKPFLVLADHLTRNGIAVLRYDDRGFAKSKGDFNSATTEDFAADAAAAFEFLMTRKDIDPKRVGLIGHSEGGIVAPIVANREPGVAFVVLMAGTAVTGDQVILEQSRAIAKAMGASAEAVERQMKAQHEAFAAMREEKDPDALAKRLEALPGAQAASVKRALTPWFRYFIAYDPAPALEKLKQPVLALNGELDLQVLPDQNLPPMEAALKRSGNPDATIRRMPGLNHLFQNAKTGLPAEYAKIEETMAPAALEAISTWIRKRVE